MIITDEKTIQQIQKEFNNKFPYLKIEFYKKSHTAKEGSPDSIKWDSDHTIGSIRSKDNVGNLSIKGSQKVSELESNFKKEYGLNVQVFFKSGEVWLQTIANDEHTLKEQNDKSESFTKFQESK